MQQSAPGAQHARGLRQHGRRIRDVMQHQEQRGGIELAVGDRQRLEIAAADVNVAGVAHATACRLEHLARSIDRDHARHERRERRGDLAGPASEIADDPPIVHQRRQRLQVRRAAEQLLAQLVPLPRRRLEELLRLRLAPRQDALQAPRILIGPGGRAHLLAQQRPQPSRGRLALVERQRVVPAGAVAPRRHPVGVRQRLQVPADGGLRQLEDRAQLRHRQLVALEEQQHPAARRIRERGQVVEDRAGQHGLSIRKSGYMVA